MCTNPTKVNKICWANLLNSQWITDENLIVEGDLNLTLIRDKIWGSSARHDRLENFFLNQFELAGWVDIEPIELRPTWSNNRVGVDRV